MSALMHQGALIRQNCREIRFLAAYNGCSTAAWRWSLLSILKVWPFLEAQYSPCVDCEDNFSTVKLFKYRNNRCRIHSPEWTCRNIFCLSYSCFVLKYMYLSLLCDTHLLIVCSINGQYGYKITWSMNTPLLKLGGESVVGIKNKNMPCLKLFWQLGAAEQKENTLLISSL